MALVGGGWVFFVSFFVLDGEAFLCARRVGGLDPAPISECIFGQELERRNPPAPPGTGCGVAPSQ